MTFERIGGSAIVSDRVARLGGTTLDLGAGLVGHTDHAAAGTPPRHVVTLDIDTALRPDVTGDAHALPFADETFDTVVASQVFEHLHDPFVAASELCRVLKPGGRAVVAVPFLYFLHQLPHDYFRYSANGLRSLFEPTDLRIEELIGYGNRLTVVADLLLTSTPGSSVPRRAVRSVRRRVLPPRPATPRPAVARALQRFHQPEFPNGYVAVAVRDPAPSP